MYTMISFFLKFIFLPFFYLIFLSAGIVSAFVSAFIEYRVFKNFYLEDIFHLNGVIINIAFLIILALETAKVYSIFLHKSSSEDSKYEKSKFGFLMLRYIAIFISLVATLLYSFYNFNNPEFETSYAKVKIEIEDNYNKKLKELKTSFSSEIKNQVSYIEKNIQKYEARMKHEEKRRYRGSREYRGPKYNEAKKNRNILESKRERIIREIKNKEQEVIEKLNNKKEQKLSEEKNTLKDSIEANNKMISSALKIINMNDKYPKWQYLLVIILLSLLISLILELIIWGAFTVLAINHKNAFVLEEKKEGEELFKKAKMTLKKQKETTKVTKKKMATNKKEYFKKGKKILKNSKKNISKVFKE